MWLLCTGPSRRNRITVCCHQATAHNVASTRESRRLSFDRLPPLTLLAVVIAGLLIVRVAALSINGTDLFFDEAQYWHWSTAPAFGYYSKPPLIAWLIGASAAVCGTSEFCVRLPSPFVHTGVALAVAWLGARLYDERTGALAGLAYALLPGVSVSAGVISTDVPLLLAWALALVALSALFATKAWWPALLLGVAFGLGLNAKYAMAWFVMCLAIYLAMTPERRGILRDGRLWAGFALGLALIAPNLAWNASNGFATFAHTADNAKWGSAASSGASTGFAFGNPGKAAEFFIAQFGVFGPFYFAGLLVIAWRATRTRLPEADRLLLAFSLPLIVVITLQAFVSRAHANWAAPAYVAATVLVIATLVRDLSWGWLRASYALHAVVLAILIGATALAGRIALPGGADPFARTLGWRALADATRAELAAAKAAGRPYRAIVTDDRSLSATLLYYLRDEATPVLAWRCGPRPMDHFEMTRAYTKAAGEPVLLVSLRTPPAGAVGVRGGGAAGGVAAAGARAKDDRAACPAFAVSQSLGQRDLPAGTGTRLVTFVAVSGYRGQ